MNNAEYCTIKAFMDSHKDMDGMVDVSSVASYMKKAICNKNVTIKQVEDMYDSYEKSLWREREDIRGDDMVLLSDAISLLQEELSLLGCWDDDEVQNE